METAKTAIKKEHTKSILVIVPAYNEANNLPSVIKEIADTVGDADILIVDDGSIDGTTEVARSLEMDVVALPFNLGIGGAVETGFKYAAKKNYDSVVQVDGDGQHDPSFIDTLRIAAKENDVVIGSRFLSSEKYYGTIFRRIGQLIFSLLTSIMLHQKITDPTSGFRLIKGDAIEFLSENYPSDYPEVESLVLLSRADYRIAEAPVQMRRRKRGRSSITPLLACYYMIKVTLSLFVQLFQERPRRRNPRND